MVGFVDAVKMFYGRFTDFQGRSSRSEYWWVALYSVIGSFILSIPISQQMSAMIEADMTGGSVPEFGFSAAWIPYILFSLINLVPGIALAVRRFHDLNQTGWLVLLFVVLAFIPLLGLLAMLGLLVWFCIRGTVGDNKYGPDPVV